MDIFTISTPDSLFHGSLSVVVESKEKWTCDLGNGWFIDVIPWNSNNTDDYWEPETEFRLFLNDGAEKKLIGADKVKSRHGRCGLRVNHTPRGTLLSTYGGKYLFESVYPQISPLKENTTLRIVGRKGSKIVDCKNTFESYPVHETLPIDSLLDNMESSGHQGVWKYLDRVTPKNHKVVLGGQYTVAIVDACESLDEKQFVEGTLLIVYIDGDSSVPSLWKKGQIKGVLSPTQFENHYNLEWYDNRHRVVGEKENSATFDGVNVLTLSFPLLESEVRLQKVGTGY